MSTDRDERYLDTLIRPIRVCASYRPRLGHGSKAGMSLSDFQNLYQQDPFYSWFGLNNPLMYAAHKTAGGMTSIYRQIGIGAERLFRQILQDELGLSPEESKWSYTISSANKKKRTLRLDARIMFNSIPDAAKRRKISAWVREVAEDLRVSHKIVRALQGVVFEVRQGYKSKDSKRQNADIANAATAYSQAYLPCAVILSTQIDEDIFNRYRSEHWVILTGCLQGATRLNSTYHFMRQVIGYDLADFFERHSRVLRNEVGKVLETLLRAE